MSRAISIGIAALLAATPLLAQGGLRRAEMQNSRREQRQAQRAERQAGKAQAEMPRGRPPDAGRQQQQDQMQPRNVPRPPADAQPGIRLRGPGPHQGDWLRRNQDLSPEQQEQELRKDPAFQRLPAQRQQQLLNRLRRFSATPPEERQRILQRMETWEHLSPEQRQEAQGVWQRFRGLPDERRQRIGRAYRQLLGMPPERRQQAISSERFRSMFSDEERDIISGALNFGIPANRMQPNQTEPPPRVAQPPQPEP